MRIQLADVCNEDCKDVVVSTVCSLSRSIKGFPFPNAMTDDETALNIVDMVYKAFESIEGKEEYKIIGVGKLDFLTKKILEETNIIPPTFNETIPKELILKKDNSSAILVNFNDHLGIRVHSFGFLMKETCERLFKIEEHFSKQLPFLFDNKLGFIVHDMSYFGTALFQSSLISIPGIVMMRKFDMVIQILKKLKMSANGYYAQNSNKSMGWLYYIYTESSVGGGESEQIVKFSQMIFHIIAIEREMRIQLYLANKMKITDMIAKALAIAKNAKLLDTEEAMDASFKIKLGLTLDKIKGTSHELCNINFYVVQIAHIVYSIISSDNSTLSDEKIKMQRAKTICDFARNIEFIESTEPL